NFSHGTQETHRATLERIRAAEARSGRHLAVLQDLMGPRVRVGLLPAEGVRLAAGAEVVLAPGAEPGSAQRFAVTHPELAHDVKPGDRILIADGRIVLEVRAVQGGEVRCVVVDGGVVWSHQGVNLPGCRLSLPTMTDKDRADLRFGLEHGVDWVMLSFVRSARDVAEAKELAGDLPVLAKLERP